MRSAYLLPVMLWIAIRAASAQISGSEDFNAPTVDGSKWGSDFGSGNGTLTQTGGVLLYTTTPTGTSYDQAIHPWVANNALYNQSWSIQLDVNLPTQTLTGTQELSIGLAAVNLNDTSSDVTISLQQDVPNQTLFFSGFDISGSGQTPVELGHQTAGLAAVRLAYDAPSHTFFAQYDANGPTGGYNWTTLTTWDASTWGMSGSDPFLVAITGFSTDNLTVTSSDQVWADNFVAQTETAVPEPSIWAGLAAGLVLLGLTGRIRLRRA